MSDESPFIEEMRQEPDCKEHRLIYADWLEEQGDPRGPLNRLAASDGVWFCGHKSKDSALAAMHCAWSTHVRLYANAGFFSADAQLIFHEFAVWLALELVRLDEGVENDASFQLFQQVFEEKRRSLKQGIVPGWLTTRIEALPGTERVGLLAMKYSANTTALSAAKWVSRLGQRTHWDEVAFDRQDFELTQRLMDGCAWQMEDDPSAH